jgi:hypothetical protein
MIAAAEGRSEAEVVRAAPAAATQEHAYPSPILPLFESGDLPLAERVDEERTARFGA